MESRASQNRTKSLAVGVLLTGLVASAGLYAGEGWVKDPINECAIWSDRLEAKEIFSWSGACLDGKASGEGVLVVFKDVRLVLRYTGTMETGKAQGVGKVEYHTDAGYVKYWGQLKDSTLQGQGFLLRPDGGLYAGELKKDEPNGRGTYTAANGSSYQGMFVDGKPQGTGSDRGAAGGGEYFGHYAKGRRHGQGMVTYEDGARYLGEFKAGEPDGSGRWEGPKGDVYEGEFRAGHAEGRGKYTAENGDVFEGSFVANLPDGTVQVTKADGTREQQVWKDGKSAQ